jgi:hypothetical protein
MYLFLSAGVLLLNKLRGMRANILRKTAKEPILESTLERYPFLLIVVASFIKIGIVEPGEVEQVVALAETLPTGTALGTIALITKL